ncbi:hypothetical protein J2754_002102 [Halarchaeum solikamskense]|uniref:DUF7260 family protein n=1 Tax=Halarchaeum nitratireducens TaxID=489913 RepID=UPI001B3ACFA9|nr:hypothetical protein [Halarchaeum solikamskense]MBP2251770.1 hypothetical protein [Halarchaeum solikamskense]
MATLADRRGTRGGREPTGDGFESARRAIEREREVLDAERDAFGAFARRVDALGTTDTAGDPYGGLLAGRGDGRASSGVREAYAETVMAVPHYDAEYGESYREHLAAEFGPALAAALRDEPGLPAFLQQQVVAAARDAEESRAAVVVALDRERDALDSAAAALADVETERAVVDSRPFASCERAALVRLRDDLDDLAARCESLAERRQAGDLRPERQVPASFDAPGFEEYVYGETGTTYPVLSAIARESERVERTRAAVDRALDSR